MWGSRGPGSEVSHPGGLEYQGVEGGGWGWRGKPLCISYHYCEAGTLGGEGHREREGKSQANSSLRVEPECSTCGYNTWKAFIAWFLMSIALYRNSLKLMVNPLLLRTVL